MFMVLTDWPACAGRELSVYTKSCTPSLVHGISASIFAVLGVLTLLNVGKLF